MKRIPISAWVAAAIIALMAVYIIPRLEFGEPGEAAAAQQLATPGAVKVNKGADELPKQSNFEKVASTDQLELRLDRKTGHFQVNDLRSGNVWYSYPNPNTWANETQEGIWRSHLRSPVMFRFIDLNGKISQPRESNFLEERGSIQDIALIPGGFKLTFDIPAKQIAVPVQATIENDSVVTKVVDSGLKEGSLSLLWLRLYPFFGAEHSAGQDGYLFIPDGAGATIPFEKEHTNINRIYQEPIFGEDLSFRTNDFGSPRRQVNAPVFGVKSEQRAFLSVVEEGMEFADIIASPSGVYSRYNWTTAQQNYRSNYRQVTNRAKGRSFLTYNKESRFGADRAVRYMLLEPAKAGYVGMAERYRQYLIEKQGLEPIRPKSDRLPMTVNIIGAEREEGLINDRYLKGTSTADAMKIVQRLFGLGVQNMVVHYLGWQKDGYSSYGDLDGVDSRLGGNAGMRQFVEYAGKNDIPVYLHADYSRNTSGANGFSERRHGQRDLGGSNIGDFVSLGFLDDVIDEDIEFYRSLGIAGVRLEGIGQQLSSDFNSRFPATREESRKKQQELFQKFRDAGLDVKAVGSNLYAAPYVSAIDYMAGDYSYDTFSKEAVPFLQIALHGLVSYTLDDSNDRTEYRNDFLKALEYGANPSYIFTYEDGETFKYAYELHLFNPSFKDWESAAVEEYQQMNAALGDVQDKYIVNHRSIAPFVKETTYSNGKRILVNYGTDAYYGSGGITVKPSDYLIVKGG